MPLIFSKDMEWAYLAIQGSWDTDGFSDMCTILDLYGNWQLLVFRPFHRRVCCCLILDPVSLELRIWFKMLCFCSFSGEYFTFVEPEVWNICVWCFLPLKSSKWLFQGLFYPKWRVIQSLFISCSSNSLSCFSLFFSLCSRVGIPLFYVCWYVELSDLMGLSTSLLVISQFSSSWLNWWTWRVYQYLWRCTCFSLHTAFAGKGMN
jgi:hypothetical protein